MENSIYILDNPRADEIIPFKNVKPKLYGESTTTRTFEAGKIRVNGKKQSDEKVYKHGETWFIVKGCIDLRGIAGDEKYRVNENAIIKFDEGVKARIYFHEGTAVKQIYTDINYRNRVGTNIKINYIILKTILKLLKKYEWFTGSEGLIAAAVFEGAEYGDLYKNYNTCNEVDNQIIKASEQLDISKAVLFGEQRILLGLKHPDIEKNRKRMSERENRPLNIDEYTTELMDNSGITVSEVAEDPSNYVHYCDIGEDDVFPDLEAIIAYIISDIKFKRNEKTAIRLSSKYRILERLKYGMALKSTIEKIIDARQEN